MTWQWRREVSYSDLRLESGYHRMHPNNIDIQPRRHSGTSSGCHDTCRRALHHVVAYRHPQKRCRWKVCFCILLTFLALVLKRVGLSKTIYISFWGSADDRWVRGLEEGEPPYGNKDFATSVKAAYLAATAYVSPDKDHINTSHSDTDALTVASGATKEYRESSGHAVSMLVRYAAEHLHKRYKQETNFPKFPPDTHYLRLASFYSTRASDFLKLAERARDTERVMRDEEYETGRLLKIPLGNNCFISTAQVWCAHKTAAAMHNALNHLKEVLEERNYAHLDAPSERPVPVELLMHPGEDIHEVLRDATGVNRDLITALVSWEEAAASLPLWFHDAFSKTLFMENFSTMKDTEGSPAAAQRQNEIHAARQAMAGLVSVEESFLDWIFSPQNGAEDQKSLALRRFVLEATLRSHRRRICIWVHKAADERKVEHLIEAASLILDDAFMLKEMLESIQEVCSESPSRSCTEAASFAHSSAPLQIPKQQQKVSNPFSIIHTLLRDFRNGRPSNTLMSTDMTIRPKESALRYFGLSKKATQPHHAERLTQANHTDIIHARSVSLSKADIDVLLILLRSQAHAAGAVMQVIRGIPGETLGTELYSDEIFAELLNHMPELDILLDAINTAYPVIQSLPSFLQNSLLTLIPLGPLQTFDA